MDTAARLQSHRRSSPAPEQGRHKSSQAVAIALPIRWRRDTIATGQGIEQIRHF